MPTCVINRCCFGLLFFLALVLMLVGCSSLLAPKDIPPLPLLPPAALGYSLQTSQRVEVLIDGEKQTLLAAWVVDEQQLNFVGLTPSGQRLLTLNYNGQTLTEDYSEMLEQPLPGREIIAWMQLAHWPLTSIASELAATNWQLREIGSSRELLLNNHHVLTIERQLSEHTIHNKKMQFPEHITMTSHVADFQLQVRTLQVSAQ